MVNFRKILVFSFLLIFIFSGCASSGRNDTEPEEDIVWDNTAAQTPLEIYLEAAAINNDPDIIILQELQELLNQFIRGEIDLGEQDLLVIERAINRHRNNLR